VAGERERAAARLDDRPVAEDVAAERGAGVVAARGERAVAEVHGARAGERADRLVAAEREIGPAVDRDCAPVRKVAAVDRERAGADAGGPGVAVGTPQRERARPGRPQ